MSGNGNGRITPPRHLRPASKKWWTSVLKDYEGLQPHHLRLLTLAAECWDRVEQARETLQRDGMTVVGRFGPKVHPCVNIERDNKILFARLVRELNLSEHPPGVRPPALGYGG